MQQIFYRIGDLQKILIDHDASNIFLITGKESYVASGAKAKLDALLHDRKVVQFNKVTPNPDIDEVKLAVDTYRQHKCSFIIAIGGGSVIDVAKATKVLAAQKEPLEEIVKLNEIGKEPNSTLIAIPTTAGSGAESTHFAVIYIDCQKYSLSHKQALPDIIVLDEQLTYSLPPSITAVSGIDAVAQAIEAYWSVQSTELSRRYSGEALQKLLPNIETAVLEPNPEARRAMLEGANLAGRAINIAKTTAPHALSYGFTANYGIPHGQAVGFTLPLFMLLNANTGDENSQDERGKDFVLARMSELFKILGVKDATSAKTRLEELIITIGLKSNFKPANVHAALDVLTKSVDPDRLANNPRVVSKKEVKQIIKSVLTN